MTDREKIEAFLGRFVELASGAATIALLAVAERSGLSAHLAAIGAGTADAIAADAGLDPRHTEEVLSALAASGVLEHEEGVFRLRPEHALVVADESSPYFMGGWLDMLAAAYPQLDAVSESARTGAGVPASEYGPTMTRGIDRANTSSQRIFLVRKWLPAIPGLVGRLEAGIEVADVGCGAGTAAIEMARAFPNSRVHGFDVSEDALALARERAGTIPNLEFHHRGVEGLPKGFGLVTAFDVIHDLPDPLSALRRIRESLGRDGGFLMMEPHVGPDLDHSVGPQGSLIYGISALYCLPQAMAAGGEAMGAAWGPARAQRLAKAAGFTGFKRLESISNRFSDFYWLSSQAG